MLFCVTAVSHGWSEPDCAITTPGSHAGARCTCRDTAVEHQLPVGLLRLFALSPSGPQIVRVSLVAPFDAAFFVPRQGSTHDYTMGGKKSKLVQEEPVDEGGASWTG